jgi:hypothetical protein
MKERDENFEEKEDQPQESALEVTELDDQDLEDASGGLEQDAGFSAATNENCGVC